METIEVVSLPSEIIHQIFSFLPSTHAVLAPLALVCKEFRTRALPEELDLMKYKGTKVLVC